jgi:hypothetical protein
MSAQAEYQKVTKLPHFLTPLQLQLQQLLSESTQPKNNNPEISKSRLPSPQHLQ